MGGKDKRNRRNEKRFEKLAASCKSPLHAPARSPVVGPMRLSRIQAPLETLPAPVWPVIAAFAGSPKDVMRTLATVSRSCYVAIEATRHRHALAPGAAAAVVLERTSGRGAQVPASVTNVPPERLLEAVAAAGDPALALAVAFALMRQGRSVLHHVRRNDPATESTEWIVQAVRRGVVSVNAHHHTSGRTLVHASLALGDKALASRLLAAATESGHPFDTLSVDVNKRTALHVAAAEGFAESCLLLLRYAAGQGHVEQLARVTDTSKRTAVDVAAQCKHSKLAGTLREALQAALAADDDDYDDDEYDDDGYGDEDY